MSFLSKWRLVCSRSMVITAVLLLCGTAYVAADSALRPPRIDRAHRHLGTSLVSTQTNPADLPGEACGSSEGLDELLRGRHRLAQAAFKRASAFADGFEAAGELRERDGIWIIEADELILLRDNPIDLEGRTLRYVPAAGGGYDVSLVDEAYDATLGSLVLDDPDSASAVEITLANFSFPISDASYSILWVDRALGIRTTDPASAPAPLGAGEYQFGKNSTALGANLLRDGDDRLSPCYHIASGSQARLIWVKDSAEKLLITWRRLASDGGEEFYFEIQAALFPDGSVDFTYRTVRGDINGAPLITYDVAEWFSGFATQVQATDPDDGFYSLAEILALEVLDDPVSDIMRLRLTFDAVLPQTADPSVTYYFDLQGAGEVLRYRFYLNIGPGGRSPLYMYIASADAWKSMGDATTTGDTWDLFASLGDFEELDPAEILYYAHSYENGELRDEINATGASDGGTAFVRDYTAQAPFTSTVPIVEPFLFPEFNPWGVKQRLLDHTGWDETKIDGIPMYQAFYTEIKFFAGAYNTGGNCGAANMGMCDSSQPLRPSLLHMNKTNYGWNRINQDHRFTVISHEQGHHWLQSVQIDEGSGPSNVLNPQSAHPAAYVHTEAETDLHAVDDSSVMGGGFWTDNADGTFTSAPERTYYSYASYELYLMGLMAPAEVNNWFYLANTDPAQPLSYYPAADVTVTGDRHDVDINMMISAMGTRSPVYPDAKRDFFTPLVLVVRAGQEPSTADWDYMMSLRHPWRDAFATQTTSRGTVTTVSPREISPPGGSPQLRVEKLAGDELRFTFEDPAFSDQVRYNLYEDALGAGFGAWTAHSCAVVPGNSGGDLFLDATPTSPTSAYFLLTMSNLAFEGEVGDDSGGLARTTSEPRCGGW